MAERKIEVKLNSFQLQKITEALKMAMNEIQKINHRLDAISTELNVMNDSYPEKEEPADGTP